MVIPPDDANIQILFTNYNIITDFLNLAFCSEHFISIKILATFNINKKFNSDSLCAFKDVFLIDKHKYHNIQLNIGFSSKQV